MSKVQKMVKIILGILIALPVVFNVPLPARADTLPALVARSVGLFDTDGTVLYSVLIANNLNAQVGKISITSVLPENTTLVEVVATPPKVTIQQDLKSVTWSVDQLDKDSILGPFTYRVKLADKATDAPANVVAKVKWEQPSAGTTEAKLLSTERLKPLANVGVLTLDEKGTLNDKGVNSVVTVGETGIQFFAPAGAVSQKVKLTFTRVPVDAKSTPADAVVDYWWCASVNISSDLPVQFAKPVSFSLPTRRTLTPGMPAKFFALSTDGQWQTLGAAPRASTDFAKVSPEQNNDLVGTAGITPNGNGIMVIAVSHINIPNGNGITFTGGVGTADRSKSNVAGASLPTANIKDGTSNTIAGRYIEQDSIIAILIGAR